MARDFVLGNGHMLVCLDEHAQIRDFYYPYVGQENHVGGRVHKLGIWVDDQFSWFSSPAWHKKLSYKKESSVTNVHALNHKLGLQIELTDAVHYKENVFLRKMVISNNANQQRKVRIFCHQDFQISESHIGDTVYYNPFLHSLIHYKGCRNFLINGCFTSEGKKHGITNFSTGLTGVYGLEGTFRDAEDGVLSSNPIEHGSVDSTASFHFSIEANQKQVLYYWICVGEKIGEVSRLNDIVSKETPEKLIEVTEKYWVKWVNKTKFEFMGLDNNVVEQFKRSLLTIRTQIDNGGAIIASSDSQMLHLRRDTYAYMWPRDGALIARSLDRAGYQDLTKRFFEFCRKAITKDGYLFHKYRPDGSLGSSWHSWLKEGQTQLPIQEDQIALIMDALWKHFVQHNNKKDIKEVFASLIAPLGDFMLNYQDPKTNLPKESYDLWEEKLGIHTFTCATKYAGLHAAANFEDIYGTKSKANKFRTTAEKLKQAILKYMWDPEKKMFIKGVYYKEKKMCRDETLDASSVYGIFQFKVLPHDDERVVEGFRQIEKKLHCNTNHIGGYARYVGDAYHWITNDVPGNPWIIISLWLAEYYIARAANKDDLQPAIKIFEWSVKHALETGMLPEQLHPHSGAPISVAPLTWSHAGFVIAVNKYLEKLDALGLCTMCNPPKLKMKETSR